MHYICRGSGFEVRSSHLSTLKVEFLATRLNVNSHLPPIKYVSFDYFLPILFFNYSCNIFPIYPPVKLFFQLPPAMSAREINDGIFTSWLFCKIRLFCKRVSGYLPNKKLLSEYIILAWMILFYFSTASGPLDRLLWFGSSCIKWFESLLITVVGDRTVIFPTKFSVNYH
jgi:hypothetical protein